MSLAIILQAGVATGTALLFATLGEILTERSGILNLGVEGMMLLGAMTAYSMSHRFGNPWVGVAFGMLAAGLISQIHAFITITLQADQVVSGLHRNGDVGDFVVYLFLGKRQGLIAEDDLPVSLVGREVCRSILPDESSEPLTHIKQPIFSP